MFRCLFLKSKIKKYALGLLNDKQKATISNHMESCSICKKELEKVNALIASLEQNRALIINNDFWHRFKVGLDDKLNNVLLGSNKKFVIRQRQFKPVLAYVAIAVLLFLSLPIAGNGLKKWQEASDVRFSNEFYTIEELTNNRVFNGNTFAYIDEIDLILDLS